MTIAALSVHAERADVRTTYRASLADFVTSVRLHGISDRLLTALYGLNAAYYLDAYLSGELYATTVAGAAAQLKLEVGTAGRAVRTAGRMAPGPADVQLATNAVLALLGRRATEPALVVATQHLLEIVPDLAIEDQVFLLHALRRRLAAVEPDARLDVALATARTDDLPRWAACNDRPARPGETEAWARCLRAQPLRSLRQALASGLRFAALLDALTLAASATRPHADHDKQPLLAAHAVRRLTELTLRPALGAWLGIALSLQTASPESFTGGTPATPHEFALAAAASADPALLQLTEAALMEYEALPVEVRDTALRVLSPVTPASGGLDDRRP